MLKKILAIACTIFMLGSMSAFALEADTVLAPEVVNGDFTENISSWYGSNGGTIAHVAEGTYAGSIAVNSNGQKAGYAVQEIVFDFEAGMKYTLEAMVCNPTVDGVRATGFLNAYSYTTWTDLGTRANVDATGTEDWRKVTVSFTVPEASDGSGGSGLGKLGIWLANSTLNDAVPIYFDDIKLTETPLLTNGDFEEAGWGQTGSTVERVSGEAASGDYCTRITATAGNPSMYNEVTLEANTEYELSFWFKYKGDGRPRATIDALWFHETGRTYLFEAKADYSAVLPFAENTWGKCTYYFRTGDTIPEKSYLTLYGLANKECYYDNVLLLKARNKTMIHDMSAQYGTDVTNIASLAENATLYAKGRFIPAVASASAVLVAAVFDESTGTKQLKDVKVVPYSTTAGAATTLEAAVTVENPTTSAVEVYMWDSASGLSPIIKKVRTSATK